MKLCRHGFTSETCRHCADETIVALDAQVRAHAHEMDRLTADLAAARAELAAKEEQLTDACQVAEGWRTSFVNACDQRDVLRESNTQLTARCEGLRAELARVQHRALEDAAQNILDTYGDCFCKGKDEPCGDCMMTARIVGTLQGMAKGPIPRLAARTGGDDR